jgi:hypothetical protein
LRSLRTASYCSIPALGCCNGGKNWAGVKPLIESAFAELPDVIPFGLKLDTFEFLKLPIGKAFKIQNPKSKIQNGIKAIAFDPTSAPKK